MKSSHISRFFSVLCVAGTLSMSSCIGDLDRMPIDPNENTTSSFGDDPEGYISQIMAKCYSGMAVSGQDGAGSSDISGLDNGTGCYSRAIYMLNEFPTDETLWIWADAGVIDLVTNTWGTNNANIFGTYSRLYTHISTCNDFLRLVNNLGDYGLSVSADFQATIDQYKLEARALRAMSYYWALDLFGNASFTDETFSAGTNPVQYTRRELYDWLAAELEELVAAFPDSTPIYGRVGKDGVEALLARLYLNAGVYTDGAVDGYSLCSQHCANIISRHSGGYQGSGLVEHYLYLFCGNNEEYMPGGGGVNEILWGIPYDSEYIQSYGGTSFLSLAAFAQTDDESDYHMDMTDYGFNVQWACMHARKEFSDKFTDDDIRWSMWCKEDNGFIRENTVLSEFNNGYAVVKFTNLLKGTNGEWSAENGGIWDPSGTITARAEAFSDSDLPLIRLADVYLMYAEAFIMGGAGNQSDALRYVNYVRGRAGVAQWQAADLTADNILDERCRELYWELTRRSDLIRHNKFTGDNYLWSWKGYVAGGASIDSYRNLYPIPDDAIAAQPELQQNPGYGSR